MLKMPCLHSYLLKELMDFNYSRTEMKKNWLDFSDLDPVFKVTEGQRMFKNALYAFYILKRWMDFNQTCTDRSFINGKEMIRFWRSKNVEKCFPSLNSLKGLIDYGNT